MLPGNVVDISLRRVLAQPERMAAPTRDDLLASAMRDLDRAVPALTMAANEAVNRDQLLEQLLLVDAVLVLLVSTQAVAKDLMATKFREAK